MANTAGVIRFLLGDEERTLSGVSPTLTVLQYLRRHESLTGTKEGCAEGDCGACTVMLAEPDGKGGLRRRSVNACIQFVPALHGRQLTTVEMLAGADGALNPVQQAMVDHHGSQCGFCTPGFVMQLEAGRLTEDMAETGLVDWLAGNLCRCTGYGPILAAGRQVMSEGPGDLSAADKQTADRLQALKGEAMLAIDHGDQRWFTPLNEDDLAAIYAEHPDADLVAGATDVGLWVTKQHRRLQTLIDVTRVHELHLLHDDGETLRIGAAVSHRAATPALAAIHGDLGELLRRFASIQIRNSGTVGGNIANGSPIGDLPPALIALGVRLHLRKGAERRSMALEDFFIDYGRQDRAPGEFVTHVEVPHLPENARFGCYKLSKRFDQDISAVMGAFNLIIEDGAIQAARIAFGGMAATPKRAPNAEAALTGKPWTQETVESACGALARDFTPISDMRASAEYRTRAAAGLLRRFFAEQSGDGLARLRELEASHG
jgi:xanthine dehydrogenase small subunit